MQMSAASTSASPNTAKVLVVGYGNTLRSDDGFGPAVAQCLAARSNDERVRILVRHLLTVDLVVDLEQSDFCVLVDATTEGPVGRLVVRQIQPEPIEPAALGHELSAASLLGLTQQLAGRAPRCLLVTTAAHTMELGEQLSEAVAKLVDAAAAEILAKIRERFESVQAR